MVGSRVSISFPMCVFGIRLCTTSNLSALHRIKEKLRSGELSVAGDQWPIFLYNSYKYDEDDPWKGLLQSSLLVKVSGRITRVECAYPHRCFTLLH